MILGRPGVPPLVCDITYNRRRASEGSLYFHSRSRGILSGEGGTTISQGAKAEGIPRAVSLSAVNYFRCVHGVLPLGDVLEGWDAVGHLVLCS